MPPRWIETFGGPFIALPFKHRAEWFGTDATDYDAACAAVGPPAFVGLVRRKGFNGLALNREPLTVIRTSDGVVLAQWDSGKSPRAVAAVLGKTSFDELPWTRTRLTLAVPGGKLQIFDAALRGQLARGAPRQRYYSGREIVKSRSHVVALLPGSYAVDTHDLRPDDETSLLLHRLRRRK